MPHPSSSESATLPSPLVSASCVSIALNAQVLTVSCCPGQSATEQLPLVVALKTPPQGWPSGGGGDGKGGAGEGGAGTGGGGLEELTPGGDRLLLFPGLGGLGSGGAWPPPNGRADSSSVVRRQDGRILALG